MKFIDFEFIANRISNLSRIAARVYRDEDLLYFQNTTSFPSDPAAPFLPLLLGSKLPVCYHVTKCGHFYGLIRQEATCLLLGPCYHLPPSREKVRDYMHQLGIRDNYREQFDTLLQSLTPMTLEMFLHMISLVNYYISDQKLAISEIPKLSAELSEEKESSASEATTKPRLNLHTTYQFEQQMLSLITQGDPDALEQLFASTPAGQAGQIASNYIRQMKNIFIATSTLVSRAAITGGMPLEEALTLSDTYIKKCEKYESAEQLLNLQYHMVLDYASQVKSLQNGQASGEFLRSVIFYVNEHLTEDLSVSQIAQALYLSESTLSKRFRREMGMRLSEYIRAQKLKKAEYLLTHTRDSITEISSYLGFSSQGHFQNLFKAAYGITPRQFREK